MKAENKSQKLDAYTPLRKRGARGDFFTSQSVIPLDPPLEKGDFELEVGCLYPPLEKGGLKI